jgi:hypothetical protein
MNYAKYSFNKNYFLFNIDDAKTVHPNQLLDNTEVPEDKVVIFPRHIYKGEPFPEPMTNHDPINLGTIYYAYPNYDHPPYTTKFGKYPHCCGLKQVCPFGYCNGPQSGRDYMCGTAV